jgi:translation initiation factor 3 subunit C
MSKFFATASDSESESSSEEEQVIRQPVTAFSVSPFLSFFLMNKYCSSFHLLINFSEHLHFQFSDDEEDTKRVVRSAREKRFEDLHNTIKQMRNYKKIKDLKGLLSSTFSCKLIRPFNLFIIILMLHLYILKVSMI